MEDKKRQVAIKVSIKDLNLGKYIKQEGWEPNYILTDNNVKISRANVMGTIVTKNEDNLVIDDGSASIATRSFDVVINFSEFEVGDIVQVIGRPREFEQEKYFAIEIIKKINSEWLKVRQKELSKLDYEKIHEEVIVEDVVVVNNYDDVIKIIKEKDSGDGAKIEELISQGIEEKLINKLLENGEIFEISPGKIKILE